MENDNLKPKEKNSTPDKIETSKATKTDSKLNKEVDTDADGNKTVVDRAREAKVNTEKLSSKIDSDNPNAKRGVTTDKEAMKTVENKDLNSDITPNRYPNSHPDNQKNRGNSNSDE